MFGSGAYVFAPTDSQEEIDAVAAEIFEKQHYSQFGDARYALMFKTGDYTSTGEAIQTGYYTQTLGLGKTPYEVRLANVKTPAALSGNNVTCNFWQGIENVTLVSANKNLKKAKVKATVKYKGYSFKVTVIGKKAFNKCKKLKKVTIGKNVKTIKVKAFANSKKLKTVIIKGKKLKKVEKNAFNKKVRRTLKIKEINKVKKVVLKSLKRKK